jgi:3-deoxy-D-manno-octulosonic-acid transferase
VSFGPHTRNFRDEVRRLLAADAAVVVADGPALTEFVRQCLETEGFATGLGRRAADLVASQRGSTAATAEAILGKLPDLRPDLPVAKSVPLRQ